jgi:hypothetical protein
MSCSTCFWDKRSIILIRGGQPSLFVVDDESSSAVGAAALELLSLSDKSSSLPPSTCAVVVMLTEVRAVEAVADPSSAPSDSLDLISDPALILALLSLRSVQY